MEKKAFDTAKVIREKIDHCRVKQLQLEQMKERQEDADFNLCRQLAYTGLDFAINKLEEEFKQL